MPVRKVKTAFLFYQADQLSRIRAELGGSSSNMGEAMTEVSRYSLPRFSQHSQTKHSPFPRH